MPREPERSSSGQVDPSPLLASSAERIQRRSTGAAVAEEEGALAASAEHRKEAAGGRGPRETTLRQSLCTLDFWLLWTGLFIGIGSGFTFLNNLGEQLPSCG